MKTCLGTSGRAGDMSDFFNILLVSNIDPTRWPTHWKDGLVTVDPHNVWEMRMSVMLRPTGAQ
ncbi:hypothetical protein W02_17030 [Nitrospira sp. KM1]|nr:hypothetical protein W02_17030 [Nitrospira sp. KM1]